MAIDDGCDDPARTAHGGRPDAGRPPWDAFPDAGAWYDGGLTMGPQRPTPAAEAREETRSQRREAGWEVVAARGVGGHQRPRRRGVCCLDSGRPRGSGPMPTANTAW